MAFPIVSSIVCIGTEPATVSTLRTDVSGAPREFSLDASLSLRSEKPIRRLPHRVEHHGVWYGAERKRAPKPSRKDAKYQKRQRAEAGARAR